MSNSVYKPEGWVILAMYKEGSPTVCKVFGSWSGSYTNGDAWRLSSGCDLQSLQEEEGNPGKYRWPQFSGSVYEIEARDEGRLTMHNGGVLTQMMSHVEEVGGMTVERISLEEALIRRKAEYGF